MVPLLRHLKFCSVWTCLVSVTGVRATGLQPCTSCFLTVHFPTGTIWGWHPNMADSWWSSLGRWLCLMQAGVLRTHPTQMQQIKHLAKSLWERRKKQQCRPDEYVSQQGHISKVDSRYQTAQTLCPLALVQDRELVHMHHAPGWSALESFWSPGGFLLSNRWCGWKTKSRQLTERFQGFSLHVSHELNKNN